MTKKCLSPIGIFRAKQNFLFLKDRSEDSGQQKVKEIVPHRKSHLKSIPLRLAEFYYNRGLWRPHTRTCIIMQETINRVLCPFIVFLKSKANQLNLEDMIELSRNLQSQMEIKFPIKLLLAIINARQCNHFSMVLAQKTFYIFGMCGCSFGISSQ